MQTKGKKKGLVLKPIDVKVLTSVGAAGATSTQRREE
jgi:hypothetical protein